MTTGRAFSSPKDMSKRFPDDVAGRDNCKEGDEKMDAEREVEGDVAMEDKDEDITLVTGGDVAAGAAAERRDS